MSGEIELTRKRSSLWLIFLLLLLFVLLVLALPLVNTRVNTSTQTGIQSQCPETGQHFDDQQEAFTLAQAAQQYRSAHPFRGNYGLGSYIICFQDGSQQRNQSPVFKGYDSPTQPKNQTHSEQSSYGWLQLQFSRLSIDPTSVTAIYAVIFSQVLVCPACKKDMISWQRTLRQKVKMDNVVLSMWDILPEKGFDPAKYPAGTGTFVTPEMLEQVNIPFLP